MKAKIGHRTNWPVMVLLILGLSTIILPLYMAIVIAFKQPSEMTNSISGILSLPKTWSFSNFAEAMEVTDFWQFSWKQYPDHSSDGSPFHPDPLPDGIRHRKKPGSQQIL